MFYHNTNFKGGSVFRGRVSFANNFDSLQKVKLKMRLVTTHQIPDTSADLLGEKLAFPVLAAPMSGQTSSFNNAITERDFAFAICKGAFEAGTLGGTGNSPREGDVEAGVDSIQKLGGKGIPFFKPQPNDKLIPLYQKAEKMGCPAVGSDLDGAGSFNWNKAGKPVERKNLDQLKELVNCVKIPVIFKGIMCAEDANIVAESGAKGLAVSNHGGRVLDSTPGTAEVLPEIADTVDDNVIIFVDGAVRTGFDVLKMLALGADFVFIGRPLAQCAIGGGHEAVKLYLETVAREFKKAMVMTGTNSLKDINEKMIWGK
jgi:isopentenyl diphosphate isomerase/L-lactate dehydrogenase-like FMN-dependent dehydrogenase